MNLDPQTRTQILETIFALSWSDDPVTEPLAIIKNFTDNQGDAEAIELFISFQKQNLMVCRPKYLANNLAETGKQTPVMQSRWVTAPE